MIRVLCFALLLICACSPRARLTKLLQKNPELIQSFTQVKTDTLKVPSITERVEVRYLGDTSRVDALLAAWADSVARTGIALQGADIDGLRVEFARRIRGLRNDLIKEITPDTVFRVEQFIPVQFQDTIFQWKKVTEFRFNNGVLTYEATTDPLKLPFEYSRTDLTFDPVPVYKSPWLWALIVSVILNILFIVKALRR